MAEKFQSVYVIVGKEPFLRLEQVTALCQQLAGASDGFGPTRVEGDAVALADVLDELRTPSLLGGRRVVIVDSADDFISLHRAKLEKHLPSLVGILVLVCDSFPKNTRLFKLVSEIGKVMVCDPPKGPALTAWILRRAQSVYEKNCSNAAAALMVRELGDGLGILDAELAKLASFVGERPAVTEDDVIAVSAHTRPEIVFAVTDAIHDGQVPTALNRWHDLLGFDRAAPDRAIGGMAWGIRRMKEISRESERGVSMRELANRIRSDDKVLQHRLTRNPMRRLSAQQRELLAADLAAKTGLAQAETAIERFIVNFGSPEPKKSA